jgi:hypothetical protein
MEKASRAKSVSDGIPGFKSLKEAATLTGYSRQQIWFLIQTMRIRTKETKRVEKMWFVADSVVAELKGMKKKKDEAVSSK